VKRHLRKGSWPGLLADSRQYVRWKQTVVRDAVLKRIPGRNVYGIVPPIGFDRARLNPRRFGRLALEDRKLHIGCGQNYLRGWINVDMHPYSKADLVWDVTRGLPFDDASISLIHSEDFIEHISLQAGTDLFRESFRVLVPGGVMRLLTPSLHAFARCYLDRDPGSLKWYSEDFGVRTYAEMFNFGMRMGGHTFIYDEETLDLVLQEVGFEVIPARYNQSCHPGLCGLDLREGGIPIYRDCRKPAEAGH
jgi:predicted SAM-dependent methyltransferase